MLSTRFVQLVAFFLLLGFVAPGAIPACTLCTQSDITFASSGPRSQPFTPPRGKMGVGEGGAGCVTLTVTCPIMEGASKAIVDLGTDGGPMLAQSSSGPARATIECDARGTWTSWRTDGTYMPIYALRCTSAN